MMATKRLAPWWLVFTILFSAGGAVARLPPPSDEARAKAAEGAARAAHGAKVENFKLCMSMNRVAASYHAGAKAAGKETVPAITTPACVDPGPFVAAPPGASPGAAAPANAPGAAALPGRK